MQLKCSGCNNKLLPTSSGSFYYCCQPFMITKLYCQSCRRDKKKACNQCKKMTQISYKPIQKHKIEEFYKQNSKKIQTQNIQQNKSQLLTVSNSTKPNQIKKTISLQQCFYCSRNLNQMRIDSYSHSKCKARICCPCLYMIYNSQKQKLKASNKRLESERLSLNCCREPWNTFSSYQKLFQSDFCIFSGVHNPKRQLIFNVNNKFSFCGMCFEKESQSTNICPSVKLLIDEISRLPSEECLFCQKQTKITDYLNRIYQKAYKRKLCLDCFDSYGSKYQNTINLLKSWSPSNMVSKQCKNPADLDKFHCSQPECKLSIVGQFQKQSKGKNANLIVHLDLIQWRDKKIYCGICLYFKYENKRSQFVWNKQKGLCSQTQIAEFQANKLSYQNFFSDKCMICLTYPTKENPQRLLVNQDNSYFKQDQEKYRLSCQYCQKCLYLLSQQKLKDPQLNKIRKEIFVRDYELESELQKIKRDKKFLLQKDSLIKFWNNNEFKKFWPLKGKQKVNEVSQVNKAHLSLQEKQINPKQQHQISHQNNSSMVKVEERNLKENSLNDNKYDQFDDIVEIESGKTKKPIVKNATNTNHSQVGSQKMETNSSIQPVKIQVSKGQIILNEELKTFGVTEDQILSKGQNKGSEHMSMEEEYDNSEDIFKVNYLGKIQTQFTTPQMVKSICDLPYEKIDTKLMSSNSEFETFNDNGQGKYQLNKNNNTPSLLNSTNGKISNIVNRDNKCKVSKCRSQGKENTIKVLNLGMLCDDCFIAYLMGMIDLKEQVDQTVYNQHSKSARQWMKPLQVNSNE